MTGHRQALDSALCSHRGETGAPPTNAGLAGGAEAPRGQVCSGPASGSRAGVPPCHLGPPVLPHRCAAPGSTARGDPHTCYLSCPVISLPNKRRSTVWCTGRGPTCHCFEDRYKENDAPRVGSVAAWAESVCDRQKTEGTGSPPAPFWSYACCTYMASSPETPAFLRVTITCCAMFLNVVLQVEILTL